MQKTTSPHSPASKPYAHPPTPSSKPSSSTATIQTCAKIASTYSPPPKTSSPTTATFENSNPTALYSRGYARIAHLGNTGFFLSPYFAFAQYGLLSRLFRIRSIRRLGSGYVLGLAPCAHTPTQLRYCRRQYAQPLAVLSTICPSVTIPHDFSSIDASETKDVSIVLASKILVCTKTIFFFCLPYRALLCDNHLVVKTQIGCEEVW